MEIFDLSTASCEVFDDSFDDTCSSPCVLWHSTPIKESISRVPQDPATVFENISNSGSELEVFDESTTSGEYLYSHAYETWPP